MKRDETIPYRKGRGHWVLGPYDAKWIEAMREWVVVRRSNDSWETTLPNLQRVLDWYEEVK